MFSELVLVQKDNVLSGTSLLGVDKIDYMNLCSEHDLRYNSKLIREILSTVVIM